MNHRAAFALIGIIVMTSALFAAQPLETKVRAVAEKGVHRIGDPIRFTIELVGPPGLEVDFPKDEVFEAFIVRSSQLRKAAAEGRATVYAMDYSLATFRAGEGVVPAQKVRYRPLGSSEWQTALSPPVKVPIESLLAKESTASDIRDIKGILPMPAQVLFGVVGGLLILLLAAAIVFLVIRWYSRRRHAVPPKPAHVLAYEELEKIRMSALLAEGKVKEYYYRLSSCLRRYIENRFGVRAPEMTTEEFLDAVQGGAALLAPQQGVLREFMSNSDRVKYAKFAPEHSECEEAFAIVKRFVDATRETESKSNQKPATGTAKE